MKRLFYSFFWGLTIFAAFSGRLWAEGETPDPKADEAVICLADGTCLTAAEAAALQKKNGAAAVSPQNSNAADSTASDGESKRVVDLAAEPWLVESVNLPANHPVFQRERMIWADSLLWAALPDVVPVVEVEKWLTPLPENLAGKYILIEVWATWCPPCRRSLNYLNFIAEKYQDDLAVVAICEMDEEAIRTMQGDHKIEDIRYTLAVDTGRRFANAIHVTGIPHVVLLEPMLGGVVWEGMPTAPGYELDGKTLEKFFAIGRKLKEANRLPAQSPIQFAVSAATEEQRATRRHHESLDVKDQPGEPSKN